MWAAVPVLPPSTGHIKQVDSVAFSADGKTLASGSADGTIRLWNTATQQMIGTPLNNGAAVDSVAFSPDGKTLASGSDDGTIRLWNTATQQIGTPLNNGAAVNSVAFSADGKTLASGGADGTIRLWNTATPQIGTPLNGHAGQSNRWRSAPTARPSQAAAPTERYGYGT